MSRHHRRYQRRKASRYQRRKTRPAPRLTDSSRQADLTGEQTCLACGKSIWIGMGCRDHGWRGIQVDHGPVYGFCPDEFPADDGSASQFSMAYQRAIGLILAERLPVADRQDVRRRLAQPVRWEDQADG